MDLFNLRPNSKSRKNRKRIGRGVGSGYGKTAGKGHKGLRSRSGHSVKRGFEGGQMPLYRRLPKKGFTNNFAVLTKVVNLKQLNQFDDGDEITPQFLREKGMFPRKYSRLKILGEGELQKKLTIKAHSFSQSAKDKLKDCKIEEI